MFKVCCCCYYYFCLFVCFAAPSPARSCIINPARTSLFSLSNVWNPISWQQFILCEYALQFQYWDVKLHTPLMHCGNHSLALRLPATKLSEDVATGERKSDSSKSSISFSLPPSFRKKSSWKIQFLVEFIISLLWLIYLFISLASMSYSMLACSLLLLSLSFWRGYVAQSFMAGQLMSRAQLSDSWHLPGDSLWHAHVVGFTVNKQTARQLEMP